MFDLSHCIPLHIQVQANPMNETNTLALKPCYSKAWKSFAKWWIPICLLAGGLMVFNWIPKQFAQAESSALSQTIDEIVAAAGQDDLSQLEALTTELIETMRAYAAKLLTFSFYAAPFAALLTVLLYCASLMAVKDRRTRYSPKGIAVATLFQFIIAPLKVLLIFLLLPLGIFVYVKLLFVTLLMLEEGNSPAEAITTSWKMTTGSFWPLLGMTLINGTLQIAMVPTVVGLIPASGFANTARAAAFTMLREDAPISE